MASNICDPIWQNLLPLYPHNLSSIVHYLITSLVKTSQLLYCGELESKSYILFLFILLFILLTKFLDWITHLSFYNPIWVVNLKGWNTIIFQISYNVQIYAWAYLQEGDTPLFIPFKKINRLISSFRILSIFFDVT